MSARAAPRLEVISRAPTNQDALQRELPPILAVHGAWVGAWIWDENFFPYFAQHGLACHAVSLRGHGGSEGRERLRTTHFADYVADLARVARSLPRPPILMGHSMGGAIVQHYLVKGHPAAGAVLLASVPAGVGAWPTTLRVLRRHPGHLLRCNLTFSLRPLAEEPRVVHDLFFSEYTPDALVHKYQAGFGEESVLAYLRMLVPPTPNRRSIARRSVPTLVIGGRADRIICPPDIERTARAFGARMLVFDRIGHNLMLEPGWEQVAAQIVQWLGVDA